MLEHGFAEWEISRQANADKTYVILSIVIIARWMKVTAKLLVNDLLRLVVGRGVSVALWRIHVWRKKTEELGERFLFSPVLSV